MSKRLIDIDFLPTFKGKNKGDFFEKKGIFFGKEGTQLYKVFGFEIENNKCIVHSQRINKRTGKMPGNAPILEGFNFSQVFPQ